MQYTTAETTLFMHLVLLTLQATRCSDLRTFTIFVAVPSTKCVLHLSVLSYELRQAPDIVSAEEQK